MPRYAFLGPRGTFTEAALEQVAGVETAERVPVANVADALSALLAGDVDAAMIAIENSVEGGVTAAQDALARAAGVRILSEHLVPVQFTLVGRKGTTLEDVQAHRPVLVSAHPVAYAQCLDWLQATFAGHEHVPASSNVTAATSLDAVNATVALSTPRITEFADVEVLASGVADNEHAVTRFVFVGRSGALPEPTGADKTSLIVELPSDVPGTLLDMLEQFATRGVNLSLIQSRPIGDRLGRYRFVIDADGHIRDERVADAILGLKRFSPHVTFLGSYARADREAVEVERRYSNDSFVEARDWLRGILDAEPGE